MKSMTGYGKGVATSDGKTVTVELKSVNNRYLEINSRLGKSYSVCDDIIRKEIGKCVKRGTVDVYFTFENTSGANAELKLDLALASEYVKASKKLRDEFMLDADLGTTALMRMLSHRRTRMHPSHNNNKLKNTGEFKISL